ncbi:hypothetical protein GSI_14771 [Ganoderma sinense ZZ0214-1]|uniref:Peptidase C14 caspase domain-containing protein n=1 Tax=Ganoderma sinense ZZ0214-1 TaxID=1077348 RepID=A0A2G8RPM0_9APHY|nr:hypothetical protein GSI_14771 [Ganoderma sinense ZZ0214-1]
MPASTIAKKALLVGIQYKAGACPANHDLGELVSTHNDVARFTKLLTKIYGYNAKDITTLIDADDVPRKFWPTKDNIEMAMRNLVGGSRRGDHIVFMYSGHGDQAVSIKDEMEEDGMDEILLPVDCKLVDPETREYANFIRDDTIREIFVDGIEKGVLCNLIFDCCHSGTACDLPNVEPGSPTSPTLSPIVPSPTTTRACHLGARGFAQMETLHHEHANAISGTPADDRTLVKQVTSWSACRDGESTYCTKDGGIFINAFINTLREPGNQHPTHRKLLQVLRRVPKNTKRFVDAAARNRKYMARRDSLPFAVPVDFQVDEVPRPQLGSLQLKSILHERFTL